MPSQPFFGMEKKDEILKERFGFGLTKQTKANPPG